MMYALLVAVVLAISVTCSQAIGEKIYLRDVNDLYYPMNTQFATIGAPTRTPEAGSVIVGLRTFANELSKLLIQRNRMPSAHRVSSPVLDMTSPFQNDGTSSAFYRKRDQNIQNHPGSQLTQENIGPLGFADPTKPFEDKVYNSPMPQVNAAPAPQVNAAPAPQVDAGAVDYMSAFTNPGTSSNYFKNLQQNPHNFPINQPTQDELGTEGFANPADPFSGVMYV